MNHKEIRKKFIRYFKKKDHKVIESFSLIPDDPSVLLTTAGMQQFKPFFTGDKNPEEIYKSRKLVSIQKCFRTSDITEVGDSSHLTFFEMLGNFSFHDYFKEEALGYAIEFLTKELKIPFEELHFSVFKGDREVAFDEESYTILKNLKIPDSKIKKLGREDNFWGPTGKEGPCGPTVEIYLNTVEIWNLVFNQYYQDQNKKLIPLPVKGVDTGMGLERLAQILQKKKAVYDTDLFEKIIKKIPLQGKEQRIVADHIRGSVFLLAEHIVPSNVEQGYVLRKILRRIIKIMHLHNLEEKLLEDLVQTVIINYKEVYPELKKNRGFIFDEIKKEYAKFTLVLEKGLNALEKIIAEKNVTPETIFRLYESSGLPIDVAKEVLHEKNIKINEKILDTLFKKHQEISRVGAEKKFGGHGLHKELGTTHTEGIRKVTRLHTVTHLLQAALREVLGKEVKQAGSDITPERTRFDFTFHRKLTTEEIKKVEDIVNKKIREDLKITVKKMKYTEALKSGALAFFKEKYPEEVTVYSIGDYSKESCGGPHVKSTKEIGKFKIIKEESSAAGVRRIKAVVE